MKKILQLKTEHLEQWAIATGSHFQPDTEQIELLPKTRARKIKNLNGTTEPAAHCVGKKLVLSKQNMIRNRVKSTL
jgi:hypothetical protein